MATYEIDGITMPDGNEFNFTQELFPCTYGVTTYTEIVNAIAEGKLPVLRYNDLTYICLFIYDDDSVARFFSCQDAGTIYQIEVVGSTWTVNNWKAYAYPGGNGVSPSSSFYLTMATTSGVIQRSAIQFGSSTTKYLSQKGTWESIPSTAASVGALPDDTTYAASGSVGGAATVANGIPFAMVDNTSTSTAYTATISGITAYYDGLTIMLYNGKVTSAANFTIDINGLGALGSYSNMSMGNPVTPTSPTRDSTIWNLNYAMLFTYYSNIGGTGISGWVMYRGYDSNQNTLGYQIRTNSMSMPMSSKVYRYRLLFESADRAHFVPANNSTSTNATSARTPVTEAINPFGDIRYYGATTVLSAGDRPSVSNIWQQNVATIGYSFQKSPNYSLTGWHPVYLVCAPQSDGSAIIDSTDPITQTLPSTEDGKIYIHLGVAYSTTAIELTLNHPVYYYKSGAIRPWTNPV